MVHRVVFWTGFGGCRLAQWASLGRLFLTDFSLLPPGVAVRVWQLGIEMRPFLHKSSLWAYPVFGAVGGSFGYWLQGVDDRQTAQLNARKETILEKRARRAQREQEAAAAAA